MMPDHVAARRRLSPVGRMARHAARTPRSRAEARRLAMLGLLARALGNPATVVGALIVALLLVMAAAAPVIATTDPLAQDLTARLLPPDAMHWLGTDHLGRDIFARVVHGARLTLAVVLSVAVLVGPVGLAIGIAAGYFGGWIDTVLMGLTDIVMAFPRLVLALALAAVLGPGIENAIAAIAVTGWPPYARLARAEARLVRGRDFVQAARLAGASDLRILASHVAPLCLSSVIVRLTLDMAGVILIFAGLGFLGLGVQAPAPEWGAMVATGRDYIIDQWWVATLPGVAIFIVSMGFNLLGDGLRDVLDPRGRTGSGS
ncbi:ABC transporter permease [Tistrella bauzanensis]